MQTRLRPGEQAWDTVKNDSTKKLKMKKSTKKKKATRSTGKSKGKYTRFSCSNFVIVAFLLTDSNGLFTLFLNNLGLNGNRKIRLKINYKQKKKLTEKVQPRVDDRSISAKISAAKLMKHRSIHCAGLLVRKSATIDRLQ